jgi:hypothetical protein
VFWLDVLHLCLAPALSLWNNMLEARAIKNSRFVAFEP